MDELHAFTSLTFVNERLRLVIMSRGGQSARIRLGLPALPNPRYASGKASSSLKKLLSLQSVESARNGKIALTQGSDPIDYNGNGHLMTIAPTRAGKGVSAIIPNMLTFSDSLVVIDPKGESYAATVEARTAMGHQIVKLDPFGVDQTTTSDTFNPFDVLEYVSPYPQAEAVALVELLGAERSPQTDPFWGVSATSLLSAIGVALSTSGDAKRRSFGEMNNILTSANPVASIEALSNGHSAGSDTRASLAQFLGMRADMQSSVLATAQERMRTFVSANVRNATATTSFDLGAFYRGESTTLYILIPATQMSNHSALLRLWIGSLLRLTATRTKTPDSKTLFLLDEARQLGHLQILDTSMSMLAGYGVQIWSFWQDLVQLQVLYPESWHAMLANCSVLQIFGANSVGLAEEIGVAPNELLRMGNSEQVLVMGRGKPVLAARLNYLKEDRISRRELSDASGEAVSS